MPANQSSASISLLVPGDLAAIPYDVAVRGELLASNGTTVLATTYTPARRLQAAQPFRLEVASNDLVIARSGGGTTGQIKGKIVRSGDEGGNYQEGAPADLPLCCLLEASEAIAFPCRANWAGSTASSWWLRNSGKQ